MPERCKLRDDRWWLLKYSEGSRVKEIKVVLSEWLDKNNLNIKDIDLTDGLIELYRLYKSRLLILSPIYF